MPKAQHPKAASFVRQSLFAGVMTFAEFEARVAGLADEQSRGDAFEVFAEAYLATQRKHDAANVWPLTAVPTQTLQMLGLAAKDYGVDGVFKTLLGSFNAYQVKFRTNRPALTWRELSTFMGLADSPQIRSRVLLTNCDELPSVLNERQGFFCIRGSDLDRLEADDFRAIEAWLADAAFVAPKKQPQPHQTEALDALLPALETHDRVSAIMACGTGKTPVALWIAERRQASQILVLVPSLALLRQVLHEWLRESSLPSLAYLCVCSDPTVKDGLDSVATAQSDLDFQVSTDAASVRDFLDAPFSGTKVVFSTYQSARVVGAALKPSEAFDLAVFDEAHKTAGREGRNFAFALEDANLLIRKRLFLTATPRHYNPLRKNKEGAAQLVFSMDDPLVYGKQAFCLNFAEAARRDIICNYKVVISVITSDMVTNDLLSRGEVLVNGDPIRARQVANQIALTDAIAKNSANKVFTFHGTVKSAASFVADGSEGVRTHLLKFETFHVNGAMPTARRERVMQSFRAAASAVMSNARCLTEGVDVPAVDMVAFLSPRRSLVDIVQATGRAMRKSPETGKKIGYVLVPLYVEQARGESIEEAVMRSDFDEVWNVLNRLQEHDEALAQIISEMRIERGKIGGFDDSQFRERVAILGPSISLDSLRQSITAACLDAVGEEWFERYGQLLAYKQKHGSCDMPARWDENQKLATWVVNQRVMQRDGVLEPEKIELLNRLAFKWNPHASNWRANYLLLIEYRKRFGNCRVPQNWKENVKLARWISSQRTDYARGEIDRERIALLEKIGFEWTIGLATWDERFTELCTYRERFGDTLVPVKWPENPLLGRWASGQRYKRNQGKLRKEYEDHLNSIGFEWDARPAATQVTTPPANPEKHWLEMFERFKAHAAVHGAATVRVVDEETAKLNRWMLSQRQAKKRGELREARINALDEIGFLWQRKTRPRASRPVSSPTEAKMPVRTWDEVFVELVDFFKLHGHSNVPSDWTAKPELARWVTQQRRAKRENRLTPDQVSRMEEIGFAWITHDGDWDAMFTKLAEHMRPMHNGKPRDGVLSVELRSWILTQRQFKKRGELDPARERRLNSIGFEWEPFSAQWEGMFARLRAYHSDHHNCRVPSKWSKDLQLASWVGTQRMRKAEGKLSAERITKLDTLNFEWSPGRRSGAGRETWEQMFAHLEIFHAAHGHANVPQSFAPNKKLSWWVATQRRKYQRGKLSKSQVASLNKLGFQWGARVPTTQEWEVMLRALQLYRQAHGDCLVPQRWKENQELAKWVARQRVAYNCERLTPEHFRQLEELAFEWDPIGTRWEEMFQQLVAFKKEHGHTKVPQRSPKYGELGTWVRNQRAAKRYNRPIIAERGKRLDEIGFVWRLVERNAWERMLERLVEFKKVHGDCNVPQKWREDKRLGKWVNSQRTAHKRGKLTPNRQRQLEELGFVWSVAPRQNTQQASPG